MSGLKKFRDEDTGESMLEAYDNDSGYIVLTVGLVEGVPGFDDCDNDHFSIILSHKSAQILRDHLTTLLTIQKVVGP